jgi:hypothetical protein
MKPKLYSSVHTPLHIQNKADEMARKDEEVAHSCARVFLPADEEAGCQRTQSQQAQQGQHGRGLRQVLTTLGLGVLGSGLVAGCRLSCAGRSAGSVLVCLT